MKKSTLFYFPQFSALGISLQVKFLSDSLTTKIENAQKLTEQRGPEEQPCSV